MLQRIITAGTERSLIYNRLEADFLGFLFGFAGCFLEFAVDSDVGVLVETRIGFHARFGFGTAFEDREIMMEETRAPFEGFAGMGMFKGMGLALRLFDQFAIGHAGGRPSLGKTAGIELQDLSSAMRNTTDDDVFAVVPTFLMRTHGTPEHVNADNRHEVAHSASVGSGDLRMRGVVRNCAFQTVFYDRFQVSCHCL